jgi:hypothetical protein
MARTDLQAYHLNVYITIYLKIKFLQLKCNKDTITLLYTATFHTWLRYPIRYSHYNYSLA